MKSRYESGRLLIKESPGIMWVLGGFFIAVSSLFAYGALGGFSNSGDLSVFERALVLAMGLAGISAGIWVIYRAPVTEVSIDAIAGEISIRRRGLFAASNRCFPFEDVDRFVLVEGKDSEGDDIWSLGIRFRSGAVEELSSLQSHSESFKRRFVFEGNEYLGRTLPDYRNEQTHDRLSG